MTFAFGANWLSYSKLVDEKRVHVAAAALHNLVNVKDRTFLDLGCGSGLASVAAAKLGAKHVVAVDPDGDCIRATQALAYRYNRNIKAIQLDIFSFHKPFDIVYCWGVLHHTGRLWEAFDRACSLVNPTGTLVLAIYQPTSLDSFWRAEKWFYSRAPKAIQSLIYWPFALALWLAKQGRTGAPRGMDFWHDVHDWLGGYPYETASPALVKANLEVKGFILTHCEGTPIRFGLFGSGCYQYVTYRNA